MPPGAVVRKCHPFGCRPDLASVQRVSHSRTTYLIKPSTPCNYLVTAFISPQKHCAISRTQSEPAPLKSPKSAPRLWNADCYAAPVRLRQSPVSGSRTERDALAAQNTMDFTPDRSRVPRRGRLVRRRTATRPAAAQCAGRGIGRSTLNRTASNGARGSPVHRRERFRTNLHGLSSPFSTLR